MLADYLRLQKSEESVLVDIPFWFLTGDGTALLLFGSLKIQEVVKARDQYLSILILI